jgi:Cu(I)/Ag(I) efflux system membrane fusion protein
MTRRKWFIPALVGLAFAGAGGYYLAAHFSGRHPMPAAGALDEQAVRDQIEHARQHQDPGYTCPMHPQVKADEPGNCPICGMKLVRAKRGSAPAQAGSRSEPGDQTGQPEQQDKKILYWYDPMRPEVHFDKPGKSPFMDMELVPKYAEVTGAGVVEIDPRIVQNLGVRTAPVERGEFAQSVNAVGVVEADERRIYVVEARAAGWVEQLDLRAVGDPVRRGQRVAGVYAPDLYAAQEELALAARTGDSGLIQAARQRLRFLGASESLVEEVSRTRQAQRRMPVLAPSSGVVTELNVREGQQVSPGMPLLRIADLSQVWIRVAIPEAQADWIREGRTAQARLTAFPGETFSGRVDYLYPELDTATRTLRARLVFENPQGRLKPGMYADVGLAGEARANALQVPGEAVIRTGTRNVVLVAEGAGRFRPVEVELGPERNDRIVILGGLEEGQQVVVSGQFLIDSEASLFGAYQRMGGGGKESQSPAASARNLGAEGSPGAYEHRHDSGSGQ